MMKLRTRCSPLRKPLKRAAKPPIATERVVDTLVPARRKHPGDITRSTTPVRAMALIAPAALNGALLDAELLAAVYVELTTTRQAALRLEPIAAAPSNIQAIVRVRPRPLPPQVTAEVRPRSPRPSALVRNHDHSELRVGRPP
jgi:DNA polymerase III subunit epsilon